MRDKASVGKLVRAEAGALRGLTWAVTTVCRQSFSSDVGVGVDMDSSGAEFSKKEIGSAQQGLQGNLNHGPNR